MTALTAHYVNTVDTAVQKWRAIPEAVASQKPQGRWSAKEIVGHLIDSACNNHARFVRAQLEGHMQFDGYDQNGWVDCGHYNDMTWDDLIDLFERYNRLLIHLISSIDDDIINKPIEKHTLDSILMKKLPDDQPARLCDLVADYIAHIESHIRQIQTLIN